MEQSFSVLSGWEMLRRANCKVCMRTWVGDYKDGWKDVCSMKDARVSTKAKLSCRHYILIKRCKIRGQETGYYAAHQTC